MVDSTVKLKMEWIDDRLRFRNHPLEELAQLDNPDTSDFRSFDSETIWTPDIFITNSLRETTSEVFYLFITYLYILQADLIFKTI